jgi:hypothetical protein
MNQGTFDLGSVAITAAVTNQVITSGVSAAGVAQPFLDRFEGMEALAIYVGFTYGSGGTTAVLKVQTTFDDVEWIDVARFDFATSSGSKVANLSALLSKAITAVAALSAEGVNDGVLSGKLRAVLTTTGTYAANTSIKCRVEAR